MTTSEEPAAPHEPETGEQSSYWKRHWKQMLAGIGLFLGGAALGRAIPPPYPDESWWWSFIVSPGFGGSLAVIGAGGAAYVALHNSRSDRRQRQAVDDQLRWWSRFSWATEKAIGKETGESEVGITVLSHLLDAKWARDDDNEMAVQVANEIERAFRTASVGNAERASAAPKARGRRWWR